MSRADLALLKRLLRIVRPYFANIAGIFFLGALATPLSLLAPVPLKIAIDHSLGSDPLPASISRFLPASFEPNSENLLVAAAILTILIALLGQLQRMGDSMLRTTTGENLTLDFRARLFRQVQRLSMSFHDLRGTADSIYRIQYDTLSLRFIAIDGIIPFITALFTVVSMFYIAYRLDWQLALVAMGVSPILFAIAVTYRRKVKLKYREVKKLESHAFSAVQETLTALRIVKAFGKEDQEQARFVEHSGDTVNARVQLTMTEEILGLILGVTTACGTAAVLYLGVLHVRSGILSLGELLLVMGYLAQMYEPIRTIGRKATSLQSHLTSAERVFSLLDRPPDVAEDPQAMPLERAEGQVEFRDVSFRYERGEPVLKEVSFSASPGARIGIVGVTGVGKSTLVNLLARFYDPSTGCILLDGVDIRDYKVADLRDQFAIVLQEPILFSTSISENIAYANPRASKEEIISAARAANAHNFISELPQAYDTQVGERGLRLSGGERQRIALARAFLKNAPILILDEPTSAIDMHTESDILEAMGRLTQGRTTFTIAHRNTTLQHCDTLMLLDQGRLVKLDPDQEKEIAHASDHTALRVVQVESATNGKG